MNRENDQTRPEDDLAYQKANPVTNTHVHLDDIGMALGLVAYQTARQVRTDPTQETRDRVDEGRQTLRLFVAALYDREALTHDEANRCLQMIKSSFESGLDEETERAYEEEFDKLKQQLDEDGGDEKGKEPDHENS